MSIVLGQRITSGFPLSIATGRAMEALFTPTQDVYDPNAPQVEHTNPEHFDQCYINTATLFRNLISSLEKEDNQYVTVESLLATLQQEIQVIHEVFNENTRCEVIFYESQFNELKRRAKNAAKFKLIQLREPTTPAQVEFAARCKKTLDALRATDESILLMHDGLTSRESRKAIVLTHFPYDLVEYSKFDKLALLESNTGAVKDRKRWYTKLHPVPNHELTDMPFTRKTLSLFGDRVLIKPGPLSLRKELCRLAHEHKVHALSTDDRLRVLLETFSQDPSHAAAWRVL